ncbi:hypothetical protein HJC23_001997 [Cyclotella cryptica]|uniref:MOSC domain-containing protein n=1 Tax=Cyclotella cryptica TaxID=29204 RepID=A0ABD3P572_9STRA
MKYSYQPDRKTYDGMRVASLHRYAVKGLSGDVVSAMRINREDGTFEDDRRFALLYATSGDRFDENRPSWLHKENFLCAFTAPELLASLDTEYRIQSPDGGREDARDSAGSRLLTVWDRKSGRSSPPLLGPIDLSCPSGRQETSRFFTQLCGKEVRCVVANNDASNRKEGNAVNRLTSSPHTHQFGNTSSGVKNNKGDTRTVHIVNQNTVAQFSDAVYGGSTDAQGKKALTATRFRPNIVVDHLEPWAEFDLIGKTIELMVANEDAHDAQGRYPLRFRVVSRTVRCAGVGVDPLCPELGVLDIPSLLLKHFPQHGPYLGVYAVVEHYDRFCGGAISVGDTFRVVDD